MAKRTTKKKTDPLDEKADKLIAAVENLITRLRAAQDEFLRTSEPLLRELEKIKPIPDTNAEDEKEIERLLKGYEEDLDALNRFLEEGVPMGKEAR